MTSWKAVKSKMWTYLQKVKVQIMDNTGELGKGQVYRKCERENLYKAIDIGEWWLQDAMKMMG